MPERRRSTRSSAAGRGAARGRTNADPAPTSKRSPQRTAATRAASSRRKTAGAEPAPGRPPTARPPAPPPANDTDEDLLADSDELIAEEAASPAPPSQRRAAASSRRSATRGGNRQPSSRLASTDGGGSERRGRSPRGRQSRGSNKLTYIIVGIVAVVAIGGITFARMWPGIQRAQTLGRLDEATGSEAIAIADEYYALVGGDPLQLQRAVRAGHGPAEARIHLLHRAELPGALIRLAFNDAALSDDALALALERAAHLLDDEIEPSSAVDSDRLLTWVVQEDRDQVHPELAAGAAHLIASLDDDDAVADLTAVIASADVHPAILTAVLDHLHHAVGRDDAGLVLPVFLGPHATAALQREALLERVTVSVTPSHLDRLFEMLDHESEAIQQAGTRFLAGNGMTQISDPERETVGRRIGAYLQPEVRAKKPTVFSAALEVVRTMRLTGAREALIELLDDIPSDHPDAEIIADTLGRQFIQRGEEERAYADATLLALVAALDDPAKRTTAANALAKIQTPDLISLRAAVETAVAFADEPAVAAAVQHIVGKLFQRPEMVAKYGNDAAGWQAAMAVDRPNYETFREIPEFLNKYRSARATDDQADLKAAMAKVREYEELLSDWVASDGDIPLGLTRPMVKETLTAVGKIKYNIQKAMTG